MIIILPWWEGEVVGHMVGAEPREFLLYLEVTPHKLKQMMEEVPGWDARILNRNFAHEAPSRCPHESVREIFIPLPLLYCQFSFTFLAKSVIKSKGRRCVFMISYERLIRKLSEKGLTKTALTEELGISSRTIAKIGHNEKIADRVLEKIAAFLDCKSEELYRNISDNELLQTLRDEKSIRMPGGLYHELQIRMTYNSSHIEGSKLSENQTRLIFETNTIDVGEGISVDDIIETVNHFRAIDYVIDHAEEPLTEDIIKELHCILKQGTKDSMLAWFAVGDYKKRANVVSGKETAKPGEVPTRMNSLLSRYEALDTVSIETIIEFHYNFERIHPFQDGNGRVGRLVALKECLRYDIVPFIIEDSKKAFYYRGLSEWETEKGYLIDTCLAMDRIPSKN